MSDWDEVEIEQQKTPKSSKRALWPVWVAVALLVCGLGAYLFISYLRPTPDLSPVSEQAVTPVPQTGIEPETPPTTRIEIPPLNESDALVGELVRMLSSHPNLAAWLVSGDLIRKFTVVVVNIAEGVSPVPHLGFLSPKTDFKVVEKSGSIYIDPRSYERYDLAADVFCSLDVRGSAELYWTLKSLIQEAYEELGYPNQNFDGTLSLAFDQLLETPMVSGDVELYSRTVTYQLASSRLERLPPVRKQFLRMGPRNMGRIQTKIRELKRALSLR